MTEYWKSNANHWCDLCKVWMTDKKSTRATHEAGIKHQELVQKKIRAMRINAEADKNEKKLVASTMSKIESAAERQYAKDKAAEEAHTAATIGSWAPDPGTGYMYNAVHRYYFDQKTGMYYGGDPLAWTVEPDIPRSARYNSTVTKPGASLYVVKESTEGRKVTGSGRRVNIARVDASSHPLGGLGGYSMPATGTIGGARGVGGAASAAAAATSAASVKVVNICTAIEWQYLLPIRETSHNATKGRRESEREGVKFVEFNERESMRKREELIKKLPHKKMSQAEEDANAQREAAKLRVQKRTMKNFGLA